MPIRRGFIGSMVTPSTPITGLIFPANTTANSDVRLNWTGSALLPRYPHTWLRKSNFTQQTGYYACDWHCDNDGAFHFSRYEYGTHPYPATGTVDATGQSTGGTSSTGTTHYYEIAGLGDAPSVNFGHDYLASPSNADGAPKIVVKGVEVWSVRKCELIGGTILRHTLIPDILNDPTRKIVQEILLSELNNGRPTPTAAAFILGSSPWTSSNFASTGAGSTNVENSSCVHRFLMGTSVALSDADCLTEFANESTPGPVTAAGIANIWYVNKNPTPTDVTDKSGAGHDPAWANLNRPTLYAP